MTFELGFDWLDGIGSSDRTSQATLAELLIRVGNQSLTTVFDQRARTHRDRIRVPLHPMAEWFVSNWWFLWFERDTRSKRLRRQGFDQRHDLRFAGDGFLFPSVSLVTHGERSVVSAERWRPNHGSIEFLCEWEGAISRTELEASLRSLIDTVLERERGELSVEFLREEWNAINALNPEEIEFCQACSLLGVDPFSVSDEVADGVSRLWDATVPELREDLFGCAEVASVDAIRQWLEQSIQAARSLPENDRWDPISQQCALNGASIAWQRGYDLARQARVACGNTLDPFMFEGEWSIPTERTDAVPSPRIDGVVDSENLACVVRARSARGERFLQARALGDFLGRTSIHSSMLTGLSSDRQSQSRAFAAEFLAPAEALGAALGDSVGSMIDAEQVEEVADRFDVSDFVVCYQIANHDLGRVPGWHHGPIGPQAA